MKILKETSVRSGCCLERSFSLICIVSRVQVVTSVTSSRHLAVPNQVSTNYHPADLFSISTNPSPGLPDLGEFDMNYNKIYEDIENIAQAEPVTGVI